MPQEIFHDITFVMKKGFLKVTKLGAVSPYGECSPFVFSSRSPWERGQRACGAPGRSLFLLSNSQ